jgi:hypothetical protein
MTNASKAGDDELVRADLDPADSDEGHGPGDADDSFEIEHEGQVYALPGALKGGFLRQADYTRKTQELAAHRRALEAGRQALAAHAQAAQGALSEHAHLAALDRQLAAFGAVDWQTLAQRDPQRAQALWSQAQQTSGMRDLYAAALAHHVQHGQIRAAQATAARMAQTGRTLQGEIDGWSPELASKLVDYARGHGVTLEELREQDDPRVWKILHCAYQADAAGQRDGAAKAAVQAQAVRPAVVVSGSAAAGGAVRDELGTKEWMKRRNELVRKGR